MLRSTFRRTAVLVAAAAVALPLAQYAGTADAAAPDAKGARNICSSREPIQASELTDGVSTANCSLVGRLVVSGDMAVVVPPAGHGVQGDWVTTADGTETPSLAVENMNGVVTARTDGSLAPEGGTTTAKQAGWPSACNDGSFTYLDAGHAHKWTTKMRWRYQAGGTPSRFDKAAALKQIQAGMTNMRSGRDACGLKGTPRANSEYLGTTTRSPGVAVKNGTNVCVRSDGRSIVGWGNLVNNLGVTCAWWNSRGHLFEADMRSKPSSQIVLKYGAGCTNSLDLQSLTTHEWGHAWGLGHVRNPSLTMHHFLPVCSYAARTLGLGDFRGMKSLYGLR